jgi:signal transduction histidine kinase/CheY-like chemotaxis protein
MSEPKDLQNRITKAFTSPSPDRQWAAFDDSQNETPFLHSLEPDPEDDLPLPRDERQGMLLYWLAGGGLIASAIVLAFGAGSSFVLLATCLGAIGIASVFYSVAEHLESRLGVSSGQAPVEEKRSPTIPDDVEKHYSAGDLLASIHDALGDMTVCRTLGGTILSVNNTFREITGCADPEGKSCEDLNIRFEPGLVQHSYDVAIPAHGQTRVFLWHDIVTRDPMLGDLVIQSIARDVTDERRDTLVLEEARKLAEEQNGLKSRMIATVSHEIRTPLSGLLGMGQLLAGTKLTAEQKNYLDGIRQSGTALVQLVEDLLDFSTLEAGRFQLRPKIETLRPLVEGMVELLSSRAHAKGIEIGTVFSPDLAETVFIDPARFRQVLHNVIGNAIKFTEAGGILVSATAEAERLVVRVSDTGPGMSDSELKRIFEEFEQGDLSRAREGGVGLGLAISARIMAEAGGNLSVESAPGKGSTFTISFPVSYDGRSMRTGKELAGHRVAILAPAGPAADALALTLEALGSGVVRLPTAIDVVSVSEKIAGISGIIVDHRAEDLFSEIVSAEILPGAVRKVFLVNPEARPETIAGAIYDSWLIRPLREQSLIDVLTGALYGLEQRSAEAEEFPVLSADADEEPDLRIEAAAVTAHDGLSILVGEDDPVNAMIIQAILEKAGHRVSLADNFAKLEALRSSRPVDVIITDHSMPDGTCDTFINHLRVEETASSRTMAPVIVLTADTTDETRRKLLTSGADLVLIKPASPDILTGAVLRLAANVPQAA